MIDEHTILTTSVGRTSTMGTCPFYAYSKLPSIKAYPKYVVYYNCIFMITYSYP